VKLLFSVEPVSAVVDDWPCWIACVTASKSAGSDFARFDVSAHLDRIRRLREAPRNMSVS
jgi:hypothetical protein